MGAQIIKRVTGQSPEIINVAGRKPQVSFNSDGHIVIRYVYSQNEDALIVLDEHASYILRRFIQNELAPERDRSLF